MKVYHNKLNAPAIKPDQRLDSYRKSIGSHQAKMTSQGSGGRGALRSADSTAPRQLAEPPMMPDEALSRGRLGETIRYRVNVSSKPLPFGVKVLYLSTILALAREASAAPAFWDSKQEEWVPPGEPEDDVNSFKEYVFSPFSSFFYKLNVEYEMRSWKPSVLSGSYIPYIDRKIESFTITDGYLSNSNGMKLEDILNSDYMRYVKGNRISKNISDNEIYNLVREVLKRNNISADFVFGSEESALASVVLSKTGKAYGEKDLLDIQKEFVRLVLDWQNGTAGGKDPCRDAAKRMAIARGLDSKAKDFIDDMALLLRAKYADPRALTSCSISLPVVAENGCEMPSREAIKVFKQEVVNPELKPAAAKQLDKLVDEQTRIFQLDPFGQVLKNVEGLTLKDIADSPLMKAHYPDLDKTELQSLLYSWADAKGLDTSFPMGSALHAVSTVVKRVTGNQFHPTGDASAIEAFYKLRAQSPLEGLLLRAAHYMEIEKGWPELKADDPTAVKNEKIQALLDQLRLETGDFPERFKAKKIALKVLEEKTGLSRAELLHRKIEEDDKALANVTYPHQNFRANHKRDREGKSIVDKFLQEAEDIYRLVVHVVHEATQLDSKLQRLKDDASGTPPFTVKGKDGKPVKLWPHEIMATARELYTEKLKADPWIDALARITVREKTRPKGMLPDKGEIAKEKDRIIEALRPLDPFEEEFEKLRARLVNLGLPGAILNLVFVIGDAIKGDWDSVAYSLPIVGNLRTLYDAGVHLTEGRYLEALDSALNGLPVVGGAYRAGKALVEGELVDAAFHAVGAALSFKGAGGMAARARALGKGNLKQFAGKIKMKNSKNALRTIAELEPGPGKPSPADGGIENTKAAIDSLIHTEQASKQFTSPPQATSTPAAQPVANGNDAAQPDTEVREA